MENINLAELRDWALSKREQADTIIVKKAFLDLAFIADTLDAMLARETSSDIPLQELGITRDIPKDTSKSEVSDSCGLCNSHIKPPAELYVCTLCHKSCLLCFGCTKNVRNICKKLK